MSRQQSKRILGIALALLLLLWLLWLLWQRPQRNASQVMSVAPAVQSIDTPTDNNSHSIAGDSGLPQSEAVGDSASQPRVVSKRIGPTDAGASHTAAWDFGHAREIVADADLSLLSDSAATDDAMAPKDPCARDTIAPWVYPEPSGGLHRAEVQVRLASTKPCIIEWRLKKDEAWQTYQSEVISIFRSTSVFFRAVDSCGNQMPEREEHYEITAHPAGDHCPGDMEYVKVGDSQFCIDRYEWPNQRGVRPVSFVSLYQAIDSCFSKGKRLCTTDEWVIACSGPYGWAYPYGDVYEPHACVTQDTAARPAGRLSECRGYFEVFDMSGNLAEWTNTRATRNPQFYNVKGGFWASGPGVTCRDARYSYFPQNRHNPVGFRCCKDSRP